MLAQYDNIYHTITILLQHIKLTRYGLLQHVMVFSTVQQLLLQPNTAHYNTFHSNAIRSIYWGMD